MTGTVPVIARAAIRPVALALAGFGAGSIAGGETPGLVALVVAAALVLVSFAWTAPAGDLVVTGRAAGIAAFRRELDRSRRHRRSFALIRLDATDVPANAPGSGADGIAPATTTVLGAALRVIDSAWVDDGAILILLPESDRSTAAAFLERARRIAPERFAGNAGIALFPDDGITSGALLEAAERLQRGEPIPHAITPSSIETEVDDAASASVTG